MNYDIYEQTSTELQYNANVLKEQIFERLAADKVIEDANKLSEQYLVLLVKKNWFGKVLDRLFKSPEDTVSFRIIKIR
jgi:hypothetical protein